MSVTAVPIHPIQKGSLTKLWVAIGVAVVAAILFAVWGSSSAVCNSSDAQYLQCNAGNSGVVTTESGVQIKTITEGEGESPTSGDIVRIVYTGELRDGTVFDSSVGQPEDAVAFPVDGVVPGFSEALKMMKKGGEYRIWIPSELGYGSMSPGPAVPADSMLVFDVEMLDFRSQAEIQAMQQQLEAMGLGQAGEQAAPPAQ